MDIAMPRLNGLEATRIIKAERPASKVVILTQHQEPAYQRAAAECGADAFLTKTTSLADLLTTIRQFTEGGSDEPIG
jgi:two-component system response regulator DesR